MIDKHFAVYGIVLILTLSIAFSLDINKPTGLATVGKNDLAVKINSIQPNLPSYMDQLTVDFTASGSTNMATIFLKFDLAYPDGILVSYTKSIRSEDLENGIMRITLPSTLDQKGAYHLYVSIDPYNNIAENNEHNNKDEIIFKTKPDF
jgi:CARDB